MYETSVSVEDARNVAELFYCKRMLLGLALVNLSRKLLLREKLISQVCILSIMIMNKAFYLLVLQKLQPILAYAERGSFNANNRMPDGLSDWLGDMKNVIEERDKMPIDSTFQYRAMWEEYTCYER